MGFWGSVGKFVGKTALGVVAPGALAGYEYQKAKQTNEMLKGFDDAIEPLFRSLAQVQEGDAWSELLVMVRKCVMDFLGNKEAREKLLKECHPNEQARTCCTIAASICGTDAIAQFAASKGANLELLKGVLNIVELICQELDKRIASAGLLEMEAAVTRMLFDLLCTRGPHLTIIMLAKRGNDIAVTFSDMIKNVVFPDEEDEDSQTIKDLCNENRVSYFEIKRKMGC